MSQINSVCGGGLALNANIDLPDEANILSPDVADAFLSVVHHGKGACMSQEHEVQRVCGGVSLLVIHSFNHIIHNGEEVKLN
jgi:hypothetical protein